MKYITTLEASKKWNISQRRVRILCQNGHIKNCVLIGKTWQIPEDAEKPQDHRTLLAKEAEDYKDCFYLMLNAEYADNNSNVGEEEKTLCDIQKTLLYGNLEEAYTAINEFIKNTKHKGCLAIAVCLEFTLAFYLGKKFKQVELLAKYAYLLEDKHFKYTSLYINLFMNKKIKNDYLELDIPSDMLPQITYRARRNFILDSVKKGFILDKSYLEYESKSFEKIDNKEILAYNHILLATYFNLVNERELHNYHVDKALEIILPRRWYFLIAEHGFGINWHLERYLDEETIKEIEKTEEILCRNYLTHGTAGRIIRSTELSPILIVKIIYLVAASRTNEDIANELNITLYQVKKYVNEIYRIIGNDDRKYVKEFLLQEITSI